MLKILFRRIYFIVKIVENVVFREFDFAWRCLPFKSTQYSLVQDFPTAALFRSQFISITICIFSTTFSPASWAVTVAKSRFSGDCTFWIAKIIGIAFTTTSFFKSFVTIQCSSPNITQSKEYSYLSRANLFNWYLIFSNSYLKRIESLIL